MAQGHAYGPRGPSAGTDTALLRSLGFRASSCPRQNRELSPDGQVEAESEPVRSPRGTDTGLPEACDSKMLKDNFLPPQWQFSRCFPSSFEKPLLTFIMSFGGFYSQQ